jgi:hypothetical protein
VLPFLLVSVCFLAAAVCFLFVSNFSLWVELRSMKNSTHQIVMPTAYAENMFSKQDEETKKSMDMAFSDLNGIN